MKLITQDALSGYLKEDAIAKLLKACSSAGDAALTCQRWLRETDAKRYAYRELYGDLLADGKARRILDVGGGLTAFTRRLAADHDYVLLDLLAHDREAGEKFCKEAGRNFVCAADWHSYVPDKPFDIIIANDLFPNVDQRLEMFIERMLPWARSIRLSLTYWNEPRYYITKRIDAEEVLCMLAWTGAMTRTVLEKYLLRIKTPDLELLTQDNPSVYPNRRQVCLVEIQGDAPAA